MGGSAQSSTESVELRLPLRGGIEQLAERVLSEALKQSGIVPAIELAVQAQLSMSGLLDKPAAAKWLRIEESALQIWMRPVGDRGGRGLPHVKIGETVRFRLSALEAWVAQFEVNRVLPAAA